MDPREKLDRTMLGYRSSLVLLTAGKVGIFAALENPGRTADEVAAERGLDPRATGQVLLALAADGWLSQDGQGRFAIRPEYRPLLLPEGERTLASILNHNHTCMQRWAELDVVLATGRPAPSSRRPRTAEHLRDFILGMENISRQSSLAVLQTLDLSPFRRMLDLGGGPGTSAITFARALPGLRAVVLDLEGPIRIAAEQIADAGLSDRVSTRVGDYETDDLGADFDLIYVSNIIHSLPPAETGALLAKCHRACAPGGTVIVKEFFLDDARTRPATAALFSINMLVHTEGGKSYTWRETEDLLGAAGFGDFERHEVAVASGLLVARKPVGGE
jgi:predicted O-methyltransferase YrrM